MRMGLAVAAIDAPCMMRVRLVREPLRGLCRQGNPTVMNARDAARILRPLLATEPSEVILAMLLDTRRALLGVSEVGRGALDHVGCEPREVFRVALLANAATVILAHNHPSGDPTPSTADYKLTARMLAAGQIMGIDIDDHLIIGAGGDSVSLRVNHPEVWD